MDPDAESPSPKHEASFHTKDGESGIAEASVSQIQYDGKPATLLTLRDVTDRKRYERRLERLTEELEALNRIVRHDIHNDMSIILGWMELLEGRVDESGEEYLRKVLASGEHIMELTEIAHEYIESLTNRGEVEVTPVPLRSVVETEISLRRESFPEATFTISGEITNVEVTADSMLASVFRNLLNNAVQHGDKDEPMVEITCTVRDEDVIVRIADNGPGIPDEHKESVFGKNEKGLSSSSTGIGLYLVWTLVTQYGGTVWITDNDPTGAVFNVRLPRA